MYEVVWVGLVSIIDKDASIVFVLDQPAVPQIADALLVARRPNDTDGVQIDSFLNDIDGRGRSITGHVGIATKQYGVHQVRGIVFGFNSVSS